MHTGTLSCKLNKPVQSSNRQTWLTPSESAPPRSTATLCRRSLPLDSVSYTTRITFYSCVKKIQSLGTISTTKTSYFTRLKNVT